MGKCFSCGEGFPQNTIDRILYYKNLAEKTGENYFYFKTDDNKIGIVNAKDFKQIKGKEYALVTEFNLKNNENTIINKEENNSIEIQQSRNISDSGMVENTKQRSRTTKRTNKK